VRAVRSGGGWRRAHRVPRQPSTLQTRRCNAIRAATITPFRYDRVTHMTAPLPSRDLPRITLAVLFIGLMIVASLWVLRPFIAATVWAATRGGRDLADDARPAGAPRETALARGHRDDGGHAVAAGRAARPRREHDHRPRGRYCRVGQSRGERGGAVAARMGWTDSPGRVEAPAGVAATTGGQPEGAAGAGRPLRAHGGGVARRPGGRLRLAAAAFPADRLDHGHSLHDWRNSDPGHSTVRPPAGWRPRGCPSCSPGRRSAPSRSV
jgi:hypothetical protein